MILDQFKRPLRDLRISVIDRCNFRCPYCMPSKKYDHAYQFLDKNEWLTFDEIERVARIFVSLGVKKLRLTGGEPLLRPDIDQLIVKLNAIHGVEDLALTTNGSHLAALAKRLKASGLKRLTVSLDTLDPIIFKQLNGDRGEIDQVLLGIDAAAAAGFKRIKINVVIIRGVNDQGVLDLVKHFRGTGHVLRFIEYMDVGNQNNWSINQVVMSQEIINLVNQNFPLIKVGGTERGDTSQRYSYVDGAGDIEFISSVSHAFCGTCNRLRLSVDGKIYTCLFASHGVDLKAALKEHQSDDFLKKIIADVWQARVDQYSQERSRLQSIRSKVEMFHIGG